MSLTLAYMRGLVTSRLDDADFETTFLDQALNEAQWEILNKRNLSFLETTSTQTLTAGTDTVTYPTDLRTLIGVKASATGVPKYDITNAYLDYATYQAQNYSPSTSQTNQPFVWTNFAGQMIFPFKADKDYTITFHYIKKATRATLTTDVFLIPDEFQELLKIGAYMRIAKREDDYDVSDQEKIDYEKQLADLVNAFTRNMAPRRKHVMRTMRI